MCIIVAQVLTREYLQANIRQEGDDPSAELRFHKRLSPEIRLKDGKKS